MRTKVFALFVLLAILLNACATPTAPAAQAPEPQVVEKTVVVKETQIVESTTVVEKQVEKVVTATPGPNPEAVIEGVEPNAEITLWTFWLSPTFDDLIKNTIARFQAAYPGVKVNWEDHQATFRDDLNNAFNAGTAPDVINLSVAEGWVADYATKGLLLNLDDNVPQAVKDLYFPGLWKEQMVDGKNYQFPYYQSIAVELINTQITNQAGLKVEDFPKTIDGLPAICKTIKEKTGKLCDIRLTMTDLLSQMVYEGNVQVIKDGKFTFDSPEAAAWLQMYVDMVKAGVVDRTALTTTDDRVGLELFTSGNAPFYQTGPNLIREVRSSNPAMYGYLSVVQAPVGKSGVVGKGLMGMSVKADSKFPKAALALAQFMTNAQSMIGLSKMTAVYPGIMSAYDDPFFTQPSAAIEDSVKPIAKDVISKQADIVPTIPQKTDVNEFVRQAIESALFNGVPAQQALTEAVTKANALIGK